MAVATDPRSEYAERLAARSGDVRRHTRLINGIANARSLVFTLGVVLFWLAFGRSAFHPAWLTLPLALFIGLVIAHARVKRDQRKAERAVEFYERGLARLDHRREGYGEAGDRYIDPSHPYERDLDIFGRGSLFELLCMARTEAGEETLAAWLLAPASARVIQARQDAVQELRMRLDLREDLALLGADVRAEVRSNQLINWGAAPPILSSRWVRGVAAALAVFAVVTLTGWQFFSWDRLPFAIAVLAELIFTFALRGRVKQATGEVERYSQSLIVLAHVLARLESEPVRGRRLRELQQALSADGMAASRCLARLARLIDLLESQRNLLFAPLAYLLLWSTQLAFAIETWRAVSGRKIANWLAAVGELEALSSLAGYAFEHPHDPFPEIVEHSAVFEAEQLGHPLLPESICVRNDVRLGDDLRVLLVSGSNMSGKSTLLRTVGTNVVLALAGAPVRARRLRMSLVALGATLRIQDSLATGVSRFYAEITRLRQLVDLASGPRPLLYLLDEILHGTNSHDRRIGAEAVVRWLFERNAIGLITTHDLALLEMVDALAPRAANVHFEDHLENGKLTFDYQIRPGVVRKSNALELMRAVGLPVGPAAE